MITRFVSLAIGFGLFLTTGNAAPLSAGSTTSSFNIFSSTTVNPYTGTFVTGSTTSVNNDNPATALNDQLWSGVMMSAVFKNSAGTLDFLYQFANNTTSSNVITQLIASSFANYAVNDVGYINYDFDVSGNAAVNFKAGTVGHTPVTAGLDGVGSKLTFDFGTGANTIGAGQTSAILMIRTNAIQWATGAVKIMDNNALSYDPSYAMFQPFGAAVPEPSTFALIGLGLVLLSRPKWGK